MGDFKPLLDVGGKPALFRLLDSIADAGISSVCVVAGYKRELIESAVLEWAGEHGATRENSNARVKGTLRGTNLEVIFNEHFEEGMFGSIQTGLRFARAQCAKRVLIFPVDTPLVSADSIAAVLSAPGEASDCFAVCCYHGKKGHPLLIPMKYADEILENVGSGGLKAVTEKYDDARLLRRIETGDEGTVLDMDTPEGYAELLEFDKRRERDGNGSAPIFPPLYLIRHGRIEQHEGKIFLGQTDVPLSDSGREDAAAAARKLIRRGVHPRHIYASDLSRALETAQIMAKALAGAPTPAGSARRPAAPPTITPLIGLRETNLGHWDGRLMDELKASYAGDYEKRGRDILNFKRGHDMENFYDMRYRVMKTLSREILPQQQNTPIVIVSHSGPIRAIISALMNVPDKEAWAQNIPYGSVTQIG
jgi:broad specificity phosphatase PhoE/CTP:molybdopterin cytidylyltransferase MocA